MATGVKKFIMLSNVRAEFDRICPKLGEGAENEIKAELQASNPSLVGNAFDILCGLWFQRNVPRFVPGPNAHPVFSQNRMRTPYRRDDLTRKFLDAMEVCVNYVETGEVHTGLFEAVLLLVQYENYRTESSRHFHYKRNHYEPDDASNLEDPPDPERVGQFDENAVADLSNLFGLLDEYGLFRGLETYFKPAFGNRIDLLKAEGDVLLDGALVDIKVTVDEKWKQHYWRQLIAYYLLNDINNTLNAIDYRTYNRRTYPEIGGWDRINLIAPSSDCSDHLLVRNS